ncbi:hypothetical protein CONLIGDRAFT_635600 [Coniochaeta ligniaria NRRL 30616]|uniref:Peroxisomal membrane protein PEX14 n=1 Tax=Coniochaeta ligniaria NRRL 30616 TaxID=1408157 RepID=A0A1J7IXN6_9PEZI|nr:hypothetical protein CONLIGDRAFT_635600 [Coniochaeta ligniaria NRRL 30616]
MGDSEENKKAAESESSSTSDGAPVTIQQAKRFLQDDEVRKYPREKKIEFLKGKGLEEAVIQRLLSDEVEEAVSQKTIEAEEQTIPTPAQPANVEAEPQTLPTPAQPAAVEAEPQTMPTPAQPAVVEAEPQTMPTPAQPAAPQQYRTAEEKEDRPPIVTYPEFLTKPTRPPPLMTVNRFLNTLYAFGGLSTLVYGTSKYIVAPMVDSLTEARISLHDTAGDNLARLVKKLEETVSEIPPTPVVSKADDVHHDEGSTSEYDDPTELFHRDIGVQTSPPPSPNPYGHYTSSSPLAAGREEAGETPSIKQARRLGDLVSSVRDISNGFVSQSEDYDDIKALLGVFKDELDELSYSVNDFVGGGSSLYGYGRNNEPDDEIKKAKENIRRVKGVLLSARSFPAGR